MFGRIQDVTLLIARIGIGVVFLAHGLQKWDRGIDATAAGFESMGLPLPTVAALFTIAVEILGSIAFIAGFLLPLVGFGYAVVGVGALLSVHLPNGLTGEGGYELVLVLAVAGLAIGFNGGRLSLDNLIFNRKKTAQRQEELVSA